jgi:hypothetical protein
MLDDPRHAIFGRRFGRNLARLVRVSWGSHDATRGALLLAGAIALELTTELTTVLVARAEGAIMDAVVRKETSAFLVTVGGCFSRSRSRSCSPPRTGSTCARRLRSADGAGSLPNTSSAG